MVKEDLKDKVFTAIVFILMLLVIVSMMNKKHAPSEYGTEDLYSIPPGR